LRYLKGYNNIGLYFDRGTNFDCKIAGYSDSDFAGNLDRRRSLTGYAFTLSGSVISWKATLQSTVALSTMKAEYIAVTEAVKETFWLRSLVKDLGLHQGVTTVSYDSQSAIHLTKHHMHHERIKHIDVRYRFIREIGVIKIKKIGTADNPADMMTKPIPSQVQVLSRIAWCLKWRRLSP